MIGFDTDADHRAHYPGYFVLCDVRDLNRLLREKTKQPDKGLVELVVASPPCEEFSRHDMPWTRARNPKPPDSSIWLACEQIAEWYQAPLVLENVRGAQKFMGRAATHRGSGFLWGDVPTLLPRIRERPKENMSSTWRAQRAMVPEELARAVGAYWLPETRKESQA